MPQPPPPPQCLPLRGSLVSMPWMTVAGPYLFCSGSHGANTLSLGSMECLIPFTYSKMSLLAVFCTHGISSSCANGWANWTRNDLFSPCCQKQSRIKRNKLAKWQSMANMCTFQPLSFRTASLSAFVYLPLSGLFCPAFSSFHNISALFPHQPSPLHSRPSSLQKPDLLHSTPHPPQYPSTV